MADPDDYCRHCGLMKARRFGAPGCGRHYGDPYSFACEVRVRDKRLAVLETELAAARKVIEAAEAMREDTCLGNAMEAFDAALAEWMRVKG